MKKDKFYITLLCSLVIFTFLPILFSPSIKNSFLWSPPIIEKESEYSFKDYNLIWTDNGTPICTELGDQNVVKIISDGVGGAILSWHDYRNTDSDVYAQRINASGHSQWVPNGTLICNENGSQKRIGLCTDGFGGAIIVWDDLRTGVADVYAQRINSTGHILWTNNGTPIATSGSVEWRPQICSDGEGGALIAWEVGSSNNDIYAQKINSTGHSQWVVNGVAVCTETSIQGSLQVCSDQEGGAFIVWQDRRSTNYNIYAQRITRDGAINWTNNGSSVCSITGDQISPQLCKDNQNGIFITWQDQRVSDIDIYAQRFNSSGQAQWTNNGIIICNATDNQYYPLICNGNNELEAIITWYDYRGGNYDVYVQKINSSGYSLWENNGTAVSNETGGQSDPTICSDGRGGAILAWYDFRSGIDPDIYCQIINSTGNTMLEVNGSPICTGNDYQNSPQICSDGKGGAIITWVDNRDSAITGSDIYAKKIKNVIISPTSNHPNDIITFTFSLETINWILRDDKGVGMYRVWQNDGNIGFVWRNWTPWINNTPLNVEINRSVPGIYNYTIEFYDDWVEYGIPDTVYVTVSDYNITGWQENGTPICIQPNSQYDIDTCEDGVGGAIITWADQRGATADIYAQRINATGHILWTLNGIPICNDTTGHQILPKICSDGLGGAIITWEDWRQGPLYKDIYAQRIDPNGTFLWIENGTVICNYLVNQQNPEIISDNNSGAIIVWEDERQGADKDDIYAQRVNSTGNTLWEANGTVICNATWYQQEIELCSDGNGGAIISWDDYRNNIDKNIYIQKISSTGTTQWTANGTVLVNSTRDQTKPQICSDENDGAIIIWTDERNSKRDVYGQKVNASGSIQWLTNGIMIYNASPEQIGNLCPDGEGGAIIAWNLEKVGFPFEDDIYAQRIDSDGIAHWGTNGTPICTEAGEQGGTSLVEICIDGNGGAYIAWEDTRGSSQDVYLQQVDHDGNIQLTGNGTPICTCVFGQGLISMINNGFERAILAWVDYRDESTYDIYAQGVKVYLIFPPTSNQPEDFSTSILEKKGINWLLNDGYYSGYYSVWVNDTNDNYYQWMDWTPWNNNTPLNVPVNRTALGTFNYTIFYNDSENNFGISDSVMVTITAAIMPWEVDGIPICTEQFSQTTPVICSDGQGGAIISWADYRNSQWDIYAQRINHAGVEVWTVNGTPICTSIDDQSVPVICSDGFGGAIIAWRDLRDSSYDVYVQRIDVNGTIKWTQNGTVISNASADQNNPKICSDGFGGAIIAWEDFRYATNDIFAQRIDSNGNTIWENNGTPICTAVISQLDISLCDDGLGGAIITWRDMRTGDYDIYAQRIDNYGNILWAANGTAISNETNNQNYPKICKDEMGGAFIVWEDERNSGITANDIYAQRIDSNGSVLWILNGTPICNEVDDQMDVEIISDGLGNAILVWEDKRSGSYDIYAQRIDITGNVTCMLNGTIICSIVGNQLDPSIVSDGNGGAFMAWTDYRPIATMANIFAQRINQNGAIQWLKDGIPICTIDENQDIAGITFNGDNAAIIVWRDYRNNENDIYAQSTYDNEPPTSNHPDDILTITTGQETINWTLYDDLCPSLYRVLTNDTNNDYYMWINWTPWSNDSALNVPINRTYSGIFNYKIEFNDSLNEFGEPDSVIVIVDAKPTSNAPSDITTNAGGVETIDWIISDDLGPGKYRVLVNDTNNEYYIWIGWTDWFNDTPLNVAINRTAPGVFNYTIEFYDIYNIYSSPNTVIVTVQDANPTSNQPSDIITYISDTETIDWVLYDDFGPGQYRVWVNDTNNNYYVWMDWAPWVNDTILNVPINRTAPAIFNYTIEFYDINNLIGVPDTVIISIGNNGSKQLLSPGINRVFQYNDSGFLFVNVSIIVSVATNITITTYDSKPAHFANITDAFIFYELTLDNLSALVNVTIRFYFDESLLNGTLENNLRIWVFDTDSQIWRQVSAQTINQDENYIEVTLNSLSKFALSIAQSEGGGPLLLPPSAGGDNLLLFIIIGGIAGVAIIAIGVSANKRKSKGTTKKPRKLKKEEISVKRAYDYVGGNIRYKVVVENTSNQDVKNISVELIVKRQFALDTPVIQKIELLEPGESRGSDFILVPLTCGKSIIHGVVSYQNVRDELIKTEMEPSTVQIKCPLVQPKKMELSELIDMMDKLQKSHSEIEYQGLDKTSAYQIAKEQISALDVTEVQESKEIYHIVYSGEAKIGGDLIIIDLNVKEKIIIDIYINDIKQATGFLAYIKNLISLAIQYSSKISTTMDAMTSKIYNAFEFAKRLLELNNLCIQKVGIEEILLVIKELNIKSNSYFPDLKITKIFSGMFSKWIDDLDKLKDGKIWDRTYLNLRYDIMNWMDAIITLSESNSKNYSESPTADETVKKNIEVGNTELKEHFKKLNKEYSHDILFVLMVIEKKSGLNLFSHNFKSADLDSDLIGGFLTAIKSFGMELSKEETAMKKLSYEHFEIGLQEGKYTMIALITSGIADQLTREQQIEFLNKFETQFERDLQLFVGEVGKFRTAKDFITDIFLKQ